MSGDMPRQTPTPEQRQPGDARTAAQSEAVQQEASPRSSSVREAGKSDEPEASAGRNPGDCQLTSNVDASPTESRNPTKSEASETSENEAVNDYADRPFMAEAGAEQTNEWPAQDYAYHYTDGKHHDSIMEGGLYPDQFGTTKGDLSRMQVHTELGPGPDGPDKRIDTVYTIDIKQMKADGCEPPTKLRQVPSGMERAPDKQLPVGYQNRAGGGQEFKFSGKVDPKYIVEARRLD